MMRVPPLRDDALQPKGARMAVNLRTIVLQVLADLKRISMSASSARLAHLLAVLVPAVNSEVRQVHEDLFDGRCFVVTQAVELPFVENERLVEVAADLDLSCLGSRRCGLCPSPPSGLARPD